MDMRKLVIASVAASLALSCGTTAGIPTKITNQPELSGSKWILAEQVKGQMPTMVIENEKLSGNAGCNNYFGTVTINSANGGFTSGNIGSTRKACAYMETENNFLNMLPKANRYRVSGNTLELFENQLLLLKFQRMQ